jgi:uroporphyrinogen decarboxylase
MTPRERVLTAHKHQQPDKVPLDFGGHRSSSIMGIAYNKLKKALGITSGDIYIYDVIQQLAIVEQPVLDMFGVDTVELGRGFLLDETDWKDWTLPDGTPCKIPVYINIEKRNNEWYLVSEDGIDLGVQKKDCLYFEQVHFPLMERGIKDDDFSDLADIVGNSMWTGIAAPPGHIPINEKNIPQLQAKAKALRDSTDRAIAGLFGGNMFEVPQFLYRIDNYLMYMGLYPDAISRLAEALSDIYLQNLEKYLFVFGPYIDLIKFGDDMGGQNGPLVSPNMYREFIKPYHKKLWGRAKELSDVIIHLHCCGGVEPLLDDFIEAGLESINPVQISCTGMDSTHLKKTFGERITFWGGGCDTRDVLPNATPKEVEEELYSNVVD